MTGPLFLVPLRLEARAVTAGAPRADVVRIGMGPARATSARARISQRYGSARPMVLIGVGGGLVAGSEPGRVVVGSSIGLLGSSDAIDLREAESVAAMLAADHIAADVGAIVSSPVILHGDDRRREAARGGGVVVDMESYWCASLASHHPFVVVRVLLDVPGRNLRSPAMAPAAVKAYRSLKAVARTLAQWSPVSVNDYPLMEVGDR